MGNSQEKQTLLAADGNAGDKPKRSEHDITFKDDVQLADYSFQSQEGHEATKASYQRRGSAAQYVRVTRTLSVAYDDGRANSGIPGAIFNFTNTIVGAGIIGLPYAIKRSGFYFGIILLIVVAIFTDYGVRNLVSSGVRRERQDYELICEWSFGRFGYYCITIFMFIMAYGGMVAYHIVIGDTVPSVIDYYFDDIPFPFDSRAFVVIIFSVCFMLPLSLQRHFASLAITSLLSISAVLFIILSVAIEAPSEAAKDDDIEYNELSFIRSSWFAGAGTMAFAYVCHHSTFIVYNSIFERDLKKWKIVSNVSVGFAFLMSIILCLVGYLYFRDEVASDILNSFGNGNGLINIARMLLALTMVFTFPMENFVARHCLLELFETWELIRSSHSRVAHYVVTLVLWGSALAIGASIDDVGIVLELDGAFAASVLAFIMPGFVILKANPDRLKRKCSMDFIMPIILIIFGICVMILGTISAILT